MSPPAPVEMRGGAPSTSPAPTPSARQPLGVPLWDERLDWVSRANYQEDDVPGPLGLDEEDKQFLVARARCRRALYGIPSALIENPLAALEAARTRKELWQLRAKMFEFLTEHVGPSQAHERLEEITAALIGAW